MSKKITKYLLISLLVIAVDQIVKMLVYCNMEMGDAGEILLVGDLFKLHYLTNPGMAFGMKLNHEYGKLILTLFRIGAMFAIIFYLNGLINKNSPKGLLICIAVILGGAIGNLIDSVFYGVWLNNAPYDAPSPWFHGQVIDMFYLDLWRGQVANWVPIFGGDYMALWPVFNIADASIFTAVCFLIIYQKKYFSKEDSTTIITSETN